MKRAFDQTIRIRIPAKTKRQLAQLARLRIKTPSELGREAIVNFIRQHEAEPKN